MSTTLPAGHHVELVTPAAVVLPETASVRLGAALQRLPRPTDDIDQALLDLYPLFAQLPRGVLREVLDFGRYPDSPAVLWLRNLPLDPHLPPTPTDGGPSREKRTFVSEGCLLGLSQLLGEPIGVTTEKEGHIVHDVIPVAAGRATQSNQGSSVFLNFHNDIVHDHSGVYTASNPDFLVLLCVRPDPAGAARTYYAAARDIEAALDARTATVLRERRFRLNAPSTYCREHAAGQAVLSHPVPVLFGPEAMPEVGVSANGVEGVDTEARAALDRLQEVCREVARAVTLRPGEALLVNNRKGLHARSEFEAWHDGTDRWLQRTYVRRSLWQIRHRRVHPPRVH